MMGIKRILAVACVAAAAWGANAQAATITGAVGETSNSDMTYRIGVGFDWDKTWLQSSVGHLTGYWDLGLTHWEGGHGDSSHESLSFAPVFVYEFGSGNVVPYVEAGIGIAGFTGTHVDGRDLGGSFNFEDRLGVGLKIAQQHRVGLRVIHYSNADISPPNEGVESYSLFYGYTF